MAINPVTTPPPQAQGKPPAKAEEPTAAQQKASLNVAIMESSAAALSVVDKPLALVLRSAIEGINERLAPTMGEDAIQRAADEDLDVSPEATADRIVVLATGMFDAFRAKYSDMEEAEVFESFMSTISEGIERGFEEARNILDGLRVLDGKIAEDIDKTYALVQEGLAAFKTRFEEQSAE
jgi:hypothetical protein